LELNNSRIASISPLSMTLSSPSETAQMPNFRS
jgi:hypothetical protein